jgi:hypothetical protein
MGETNATLTMGNLEIDYDLYRPPPYQNGGGDHIPASLRIKIFRNAYPLRILEKRPSTKARLWY